MLPILYFPRNESAFGFIKRLSSLGIQSNYSCFINPQNLLNYLLLSTSSIIVSLNVQVCSLSRGTHAHTPLLVCMSSVPAVCPIRWYWLSLEPSSATSTDFAAPLVQV